MQRAARIELMCDRGELVLRLDLQRYPALESMAHDTQTKRRVALVNLYLAPLLAPWQAAGISGLAITDLTLVNNTQQSGLTIQSGALVCAVEAISTSLLAGWAANTQASASSSQIQVGGHVRLASRSLSLAQMQALETGDVVLGWPFVCDLQPDLNQSTFAAQLRLGGTHQPCYCAPVHLSGHAVTLQGPASMEEQFEFASGGYTDTASYASAPTEADYGDEHEQGDDAAYADQAEQADQADQAAPRASLAQLNLPVHLELTVLPMPLGALQTLAPGYLLELPLALADAEIRLVTSGQTFAMGQLVAIGDNLGVQITRVLAGHEFQS